jgi:PKD repeat protein
MIIQRCICIVLFVFSLHGVALSQPCVDVSIPTNSCVPEIVQFSDCTPDPHLVILWTLYTPDGEVFLGNDSLVSYTITVPGMYVIYLAVEIGIFPLGATDTFFFSAPPDIVSVFASDTQGCAPLDVCFIPNIEGGSFPQTYLWDFGDSTTSTVFAPCHTFEDSGCYDVTFSVVDAAGCGADTTIPDFVCVFQPPNICFSTGGVPPVNCLAPLSVDFMACSTADSGLVYNWSFPGGTPSFSSNDSVTVLYDTDGTYDFSVTATNAAGCSDTLTMDNYIHVGDFTLSVMPLDTNVCVNSQVCFNLFSNYPVAGVACRYWHNGMLVNIPMSSLSLCLTLSESGDYFFQFIATATSGCKDTVSFNVIVNGINADFIADVTYASCPSLTVNFDNVTPGIDSLVIPTVWYYGEGPIGSLTTDGFYTYTEPGCYDVTMIVVSPDGCIDTVFKPCYIQIDGPFAEVSTTVDDPCGPTTVCYNLDSTNAISFLFCPGNNTTCIFGPLDSLCVTYDSLGVYNPTLLICDNIGCCYEKMLPPVYVDSIVAAFGVSQNVVCGASAVQFTDSSYSAIGINSWQWDFGDGSTSIGNGEIHVYPDTGCYDVSLIVTGLGGCADTAVGFGVVCVLENATAQIISTGASACDTPHTVCFNAADVNSFSTVYTWTFQAGDPLSSNADSVCVDYLYPGSYSVTLVALAPSGCSDTTVLNNYVNIGTPPVITMTASDSIVIIGDTIVFTTSAAGTSTQWTVTPSAGVIQSGTPSTENEIIFLQTGNYEVCAEITIPGGCVASDCIEVVITDTLDFIDPLNNATFIQIYPNPITSEANLITRSNTTENISVNVLSIDGKLISTQNLNLHQGVNEAKLDISDLQNGIYMLQVKSQTFNATRKLVIQR